MSNSVRECLHRQRGEKTGKFAIIFANMHIHIVYAVSEPAHLFSAYPFFTVKTNNGTVLSQIQHKIGFDSDLGMYGRKQHYCRYFCFSTPTLFNKITASWFNPVILKVSPASPSTIIKSIRAFSPRSASVADRRPISTPGTANSETENDHIPAGNRDGVENTQAKTLKLEHHH